MSKAHVLLRKAGDLARQKKWQEAVEVYLQATETIPTEPRCWFGLGICLLKVGNSGMARVALQRAQRMGHPKAAKALSYVDGKENGHVEARENTRPEAEPAANIAPADLQQGDNAGPVEPVLSPPPEEKIDLGRHLPIMLVEPIESHQRAIRQAIEGTIRNAEVAPVPYTVSCADTMSGRVYYYVAVLDWDADPDAAAGLTQILKIKRPEMLIVCLTHRWDPASSARILKAGADYHLVKSPQFANLLPIVIAQWARRDEAVLKQRHSLLERGGPQDWPQCINAMGEMMIVVDADYTIVQANSAAAEAFDEGEMDLVGRPYPHVLHGADEPPESCPISQVLRDESPSAGVIRHPVSGRALRVRSWPLVSESRKVCGAVSLLAEEISAEGRGGETARQDGELADLLKEGANRLQCGMVVLDNHGRIAWVNDPAADFLCMDKAALAGEDYLSILSRSLHDLMSQPEAFLDILGDAHRNGGNLRGHPLRLATGHKRTALQYWSTPVRGASPHAGRVEHFYLAEGGDKAPLIATGDGPPLAQLLEAIGDVHFSSDVQGRIDWSSPAAHMPNCGLDELQGTFLPDLAAPQAREKLQRLLQQALSDGARTWREEFPLRCADGKHRWAELALVCNKDPEGKEPRKVEGILRDVTDRKVSEAIRAIVAGEVDL